MYSPKIREDLIPILYQLGKEQGKPMTKVVDEILRGYLILKQEYSVLNYKELLEKIIYSNFSANYIPQTQFEMFKK